jgi:hypothetical protein
LKFELRSTGREAGDAKREYSCNLPVLGDTDCVAVADGAAVCWWLVAAVVPLGTLLLLLLLRAGLVLLLLLKGVRGTYTTLGGDTVPPSWSGLGVLVRTRMLGLLLVLVGTLVAQGKDNVRDDGDDGVPVIVWLVRGVGVRGVLLLESKGVRGGVSRFCKSA